ncbi:hypothetical protein WMY93_002872 [Mugilogobius chulae]|uniref:RAP domain-containing protein n=1 Tax=Mugilogobius chulae TaxID=88201 RepID=A0AAW0QA64_9GOBI
MLRLQCVGLRRLLHSGTVNRDLVLEQLRGCCIEDHVFDVVGKNKAKLNVDHVSMAVGMLWQFQKEKPQLLRTVDLIKNHPQFLTLRVLAENKISLMDDMMLIDTLYNFLRLNVDPHDSLIQQLVSEAWLRLNQLPMPSLSKFSICLSDQYLHHSPLMGQITNIMAQKLSTISDARILTTLMISVSSLVSPSLRDAVITRIDKILDTVDPSNYNNPRRVVQFLRNIKSSHRPLLEKFALLCNLCYAAPFSVLNYDTVKAEEMFEACIRHFTPHITLPDALNMRVRLRLMELNRAVCLECPEYQVPWFHERYCQRLQKKVNGSINPLQQQIHKMLGEVLGGMNYVRIAVVTPYFYTVHFECILDKDLNPLPYVETTSSLPIPSRGQAQWETDSHFSIRDELPPCAQRIAVDFLDSKSFCKNSHHIKGETLMRKRHLEILGYCVIQIPHFEWNSMELSTQDAWKDYLKKKIFRECSL